MIIMLRNIHHRHTTERFWVRFWGFLALVAFCSFVLGMCSQFPPSGSR